MHWQSFLGDLAYYPQLASAKIAIDIDALDIHPSTRGFCYFELGWAEGGDSPAIGLADLISPTPWTTSAVEAYQQLPDEEKEKTLFLLTFYIHELTHHLDHMITPFGVMFHGFLCLDYLAMQEAVPYLLDLPEGALDPPLRDLNLALLDFEVLLGRAPNAPVDLWEELRRYRRVTEVYRRVTKRDVDEGWGVDQGEPTTLLGQEIRPILVDGDLRSIRVPGTEHYLGVLAILEAHAVGNCIRRISSIFGRDVGQAKTEVLRFLRVFYHTVAHTMNYWACLHLLSGLYDQPDFPSLVAQRQTLIELEQVPTVLQALPWFAFHGTNPVEHFLAGAAFVGMRVRDGEGFKDPQHLIQSLESFRPHDTDESLPKVEDRLRASLAFLQTTQARNLKENANSELRKHFEHIFSIQSAQISKRQQSGYASPLGLAPDGNPTVGFSEDDFDLLLVYEPPESVANWFLRRDQLLYLSDAGGGFGDAEKRQALVETFGHD